MCFDEEMNQLTKSKFQVFWYIESFIEYYVQCISIVEKIKAEYTKYKLWTKSMDIRLSPQSEQTIEKAFKNLLISVIVKLEKWRPASVFKNRTVDLWFADNSMVSLQKHFSKFRVKIQTYEKFTERNADLYMDQDNLLTKRIKYVFSLAGKSKTEFRAMQKTGFGYRREI